MQREINILKMTLMERNEEIENIKKAKMLEIDRAKEEAFDRAEKRFVENAHLRDARFKEEKDELQASLQAALKEDTAKYNKLFVTHALTKWRLITQIMKMKMGDEAFANSTLEDVIQAI
jgi:hypothetical protein